MNETISLFFTKINVKNKASRIRIFNSFNFQFIWSKFNVKIFLTNQKMCSNKTIIWVRRNITYHCKNNKKIDKPLFSLFFFFFDFSFNFNWRLIILQYCGGFAIHSHESAMGVYVSHMLILPPTSLPIPSLRVIPVHQPWAPCLMHRTWTGDLFHMLIYMFQCYSLKLMLFSQIIPPSPSPTESTSLFFTSVSLLLSRI